MNKKVLSAAALLVMSVTNVAHADEVEGNGGHGTVNFSGAVTAQTCDSGIFDASGNEVAFVELPVITTDEFFDSASASDSSAAAVDFGIAPLDGVKCDATSASLSLTGKTVTGHKDVLENTADIKTGVGVKVLFADGTTSLLNQGYVTVSAANFDADKLMVNLKANYFKTGADAHAGLVASVASYQIAYL